MGVEADEDSVHMEKTFYAYPERHALLRQPRNIAPLRFSSTKTLRPGPMYTIPSRDLTEAEKRRIHEECTIMVKSNGEHVPRTLCFADDDADGMFHIPPWAAVQLFPDAHFESSTFVERCAISSDAGAYIYETDYVLLENHRAQKQTCDAAVNFFDAMSKRPGHPLSCMICKPCGHGKTTTFLFIMRQLRQKTLVMVTTTTLVQQWEAEVSKVFPKLRIGTDICIMTVQKLHYMLENSKEEFDKYVSGFGLVCFDETHKLGAPTYLSVWRATPAKYRIAMTATPRRTETFDKEDFNFFQLHMGPIVFYGLQELTIGRMCLYYDTPLNPVHKYGPFKGKPNMQSMYMKLGKDNVFCTLAATAALAGVQEGYWPLVITKYKDTATNIGRRVEAALKSIPIETEDPPGGRRPVTAKGRSRKRQRPEAEVVLQDNRLVSVICGSGEIHTAARVLIGTESKIGTGFDVPYCDLLIVITYNSDIKQIIGRITREYPDKKPPRVIEIIPSQYGPRIRHVHTPSYGDTITPDITRTVEPRMTKTQKLFLYQNLQEFLAEDEEEDVV